MEIDAFGRPRYVYDEDMTSVIDKIMECGHGFSHWFGFCRVCQKQRDKKRKLDDVKQKRALLRRRI